MTLEELAALVASARFLPRGVPAEEAAVRVVPALLEGLPPTQVMARGPRIPSGCGEALGLARLLPLLTAAAAAEHTEPLPGVTDPFVVDLSALVAEGARHSAGAAVVPLLEVLHAAAEAQTAPGIAELHTGDPVVSGASLRRVSVAVQGRLAAACTRVSEHERVPALAWALSRARLLPIYPRGTLDREVPWARVAAVLDVPVPPGTVEAVEAALKLTVKGVMERRAAGKSTPEDAAILLRHLTPARLAAGVDEAAGQLLLDPDALAAILPGLARFTDAKALAAVGVDSARASRLLTPAGGVATASALAEVIEALREWDVLSQIVAAIAPAPVRALAVPRGVQSRAAVVLVGLSRLRADAGGATTVEQGWRELRQRAEAGVTADYGYAGLAAFPDPVEALRFALAATRRLEGAPISMAWGVIQGGTDGRRTTVSGPAVEGAIRWLAAGPLPARAGADEGPTRLRVNGGWLCGTGFAIEAGAAEALQETRVRRGLLTDADGPPGGDSRVPRSLDLFTATDFEGSVLALVRIPGVAGGFEVVQLPQPEWRKLLDKDDERAAASGIPAPVVAVATDPGVTPAVAGPEEGAQDDTGAWEMAELDELPDEAPVTLDLAEGTADLPPMLPEQPGFDFHEDSGEVPPEEAPNFSGFYLPDADKPVPLSRPSRPATLPPVEPPVFDIEVEDEEETEEWQPVVARSATLPPTRATPPTSATLPIPPGESARLLPPEPDLPPVFAVEVDEDTFEVPEELREPLPGEEAAPAAGLDLFDGDLFAAPAELTGDPPPTPAEAPIADPFAAAPSAALAETSFADPFAGPLSPGPVEPVGFTDPFASSAPTGDSHGFSDPFAASPAPAAEAVGGSLSPEERTGEDGGFGLPPAAEVAAPPAPSPEESLPPRTEGRSGRVYTLPPSVTAKVASIAAPSEDSRPPRRAAEPVRENTGDPGSAPSSPSRSGRGRLQATMDFDFLLKGYAVFFDRKEAVFGRPYGTRIVDRHVYPYQGDADAAYRSFLKDKIQEGFVPRADLIGDLPRGVTVMPLDTDKLQAAWKDLS